MTPTPVEVRDNPDLRRLEAILDTGEVAGFAMYQLGPEDSVTFFHTEVEDRFEGQGIGSQLVEGVMDHLRANHLRIVPPCPFIRRWMRRHPETHELLADGASVR